MNFIDTSRQVTVLGGGIVGVSCSLALQSKGWRVTMVDRLDPGQETSAGNAGVLSRSSLLPFNRPGLGMALPSMLLKSSPGFRLRASALDNWPWMLKFLWHARRSTFDQTTMALDALIQLSVNTHKVWMDQAQAKNLLLENGWLWLYQNPAAFEASAFVREVLQEFSVANEVLSPHGLHDLEPHVAPHFSHGLWIKDAVSVLNPQALVKIYAQQFLNAGGVIEHAEVTALSQQLTGWQWQTVQGQTQLASNVVVALGPWSGRLLAASRLPSRFNMTIGFERGYHRQFKPVEGVHLRRPIYDMAGAYVLSPMQNEGGDPVMRMTTGVELAAHDAKANWEQLEAAENAARKIFPMKETVAEADWLGSRPTLPDSRPVIGELTNCPGLWLAFGHQHIGFSTGPGTGVLLAELMSSESTSIDAQAFRPERFEST